MNPEKAYCTCGKCRSYTQDVNGVDWVCTNCHKPSKGWLEKIVIPRILADAQNNMFLQGS